MQLIKRLRCKWKTGHTFKWRNDYMIDAGMGKIRVYQCSQCGKEKREVV